MPASLLGLVIVSALVPGYLCLLITTPVRRPSRASALYELLEVITIGIATTGIICLGFAVVGPSSTSSFLSAVKTVSSGQSSAKQVRLVGTDVAVVLASSIALAAGAGRGWRWFRRSSKQYAPSVHQQVLSPKDGKHNPYVVVTLRDGGEVSGYLQAYNMSDTADDRVIAVQGSPGNPVGYRSPVTHEQIAVPGDDVLLMVYGSDISQVTVRQIPNQAAPNSS